MHHSTQQSPERFKTPNGHAQSEHPTITALHTVLREAFGWGIERVIAEGNTKNFTATVSFLPEPLRGKTVRAPVSIHKKDKTITIDGLSGTASHAVQALIEKALTQYS